MGSNESVGPIFKTNNPTNELQERGMIAQYISFLDRDPIVPYQV